MFKRKKKKKKEKRKFRKIDGNNKRNGEVSRMSAIVLRETKLGREKSEKEEEKRKKEGKKKK